MKPVSEPVAEPNASDKKSLVSLLRRLQALSQEPAFELQRQAALKKALRPYVEGEEGTVLSPLPEEIGLGEFYLFADYLPDDGQFSLIEQVRDTITTHVPEEERIWLDPLRHSRMDVLEVVSSNGGELSLRSLGSGASVRAVSTELSPRCQAGEVLLARLMYLPDHAVMLDVAVVMSASIGHALLAAANEWRRAVEVQAGSFELGEWEEFTKSYGYILLWQLARVRLETLIRTDTSIRYRTPSGQPFLYVLAAYEHHASGYLSEGLSRIKDWRIEQPGERWVQVEDGAKPGEGSIVARLTLTPVQLIVECDSEGRLDRVKHQLASTFGFALHFCGEAVEVPPHELPSVNLEEDQTEPISVIVSPEIEQELLKVFLETVYLEWADRPSPVLNGRTPRDAMAVPDSRAKIEALIRTLEQHDLALRRTGTIGYDYNRLRAHVGL